MDVILEAYFVHLGRIGWQIWYQKSQVEMQPKIIQDKLKLTCCDARFKPDVERMWINPSAIHRAAFSPPRYSDRKEAAPAGLKLVVVQKALRVCVELFWSLISASIELDSKWSIWERESMSRTFVLIGARTHVCVSWWLVVSWLAQLYFSTSDKQLWLHCPLE